MIKDVKYILDFFSIGTSYSEAHTLQSRGCFTWAYEGWDTQAITIDGVVISLLWLIHDYFTRYE